MSRHPFLDHPAPIAFAHRGGSLEAEENTMEAFARAVDLGFTHIETDVHASRDGVIVVHHDESLSRMTGQDARIAELDWAEICEIRTHGGAKIPRLEEVFASFPNLFVNIELKSDAGLPELANLIRDTGALDRICAGSFSGKRTNGLRDLLGPDLCWSPSHGGVFALWLAGWGIPMPRLGFPVIQVPTHHQGIPVVTPRVVRAAAARDIEVQVWTVDDAAEMARLLDMGVGGIMTDRPTVLKQVMQDRTVWHGTP